MTRIVFLQEDGERTEVDAMTGQSLMQIALSNLVPGVVAECGGALSCATCHVYVDEQWIDKLPAKSSDEDEMLQVTAEEPTAGSRLACQIKIDSTLDGLTVRIPRIQK